MQKCFKSVLKIFLCLSWNNNYSKVENDIKNFSLKHDIAGYHRGKKCFQRSSGLFIEKLYPASYLWMLLEQK